MDDCLREPDAGVDSRSPTPQLLAYCRRPFDVRTAAIAFGVSPSSEQSESVVKGYRDYGSPIVVLSVRENVEIWRQGAENPERKETLPVRQLAAYFDKHKQGLSPQAVYRAKNLGQVNDQYQMEFVDAGLMPFLERNVGEKLGKLLTSVVADVMPEWGRVQGSTLQEGDLLLRSVFRLLAGKILCDKEVRKFKSLSVSDPADILRRVTTHCGGMSDEGAFRRGAFDLLEGAGTRIFEQSSLRDMSTESLGVIYESTFISKETREKLGTHSTPPWLADYMMWQVEDWFKEIPTDERIVYEPACGHGAFLVAALRMLQQFAFEEKLPYDKTAAYLRRMLHGADIDTFSLEIARLSLSLTDIPNANGWNLLPMNLFAEDPFVKRVQSPALVLTNPPYEAFKEQERLGWKCTQYTKYAEIIARTLPHIRENGIICFIAPRSFLTRKSEADIRKTLATEFEIREIDQFPDKIFQYASSQPCVVIARRKGPKPIAKVRCGYVSECGVDAFRERYCFESVQELNVSDIVSEPDFKLCVPLLFTLWRSLSYNPILKDIADVGRGLDLRSDCSAKGCRSTREILWSLDSKVLYHKEPQPRDVAFEDSDVLFWRSGASIGTPQIVVNAARVRRNIWPIRALIDTKGLYVSTNLYTIRPKNKMYSVEFLWALLNSPIANAFVHSKSGKLHIIQETLETMPFPRIHASHDLEATVYAVKAYFKATNTLDNFDYLQGMDKEKLKQLRLQVDAEVLKLYDLAPRDERMLLDLFSGHKRAGVPFEQTEYFSRDFTPFIPLHEYLSPEFQRSTAGEIRKIDFAKALSPRMKEALRRAVELYSDEE